MPKQAGPRPLPLHTLSSERSQLLLLVLPLLIPKSHLRSLWLAHACVCMTRPFRPVGATCAHAPVSVLATETGEPCCLESRAQCGFRGITRRVKTHERIN